MRASCSGMILHFVGCLLGFSASSFFSSEVLGFLVAGFGLPISITFRLLLEGGELVVLAGSAVVAGCLLASFKAALKDLLGFFVLSTLSRPLSVDFARARHFGVSTTMVSWVSVLKGLALLFWKAFFPLESGETSIFGQGFWASST